MATTFGDYSTVFCSARVGKETTDTFVPYAQLEDELKEAQMNTVKNHLKCQATNSGGGGASHGGGSKRKKRISFAPQDGVKVYKYDTTSPSQSDDEATVEYTDINLKGRLPMAIVNFYENEIHSLVVGAWTFENCSCRNRESFRVIFGEYPGLTTEQLCADLREICEKLLSGKPVALDSKKGIYVRLEENEMVLNTFLNEYCDTGRKINSRSILLKFLDIVEGYIKESAISIQCAWRQNRARKMLRTQQESQSNTSQREWLRCMCSQAADNQQSHRLTAGAKKVLRCPECTRPVDGNGECFRCSGSYNSGGGGGMFKIDSYH